MTETTEYAVILTTNYYGPSVKHDIVRDDNGDQLPIFDDLDSALAAVPDQSGPLYLGHNESSHSVSVWEVVRDIDPCDWCGWPTELEDAANEILTDLGIDPEDPEATEDLDFDLPSEAAVAIGCCLVRDDRNDRCLLCKRID